MPESNNTPFSERTSFEQVEEGLALVPKFDADAAHCNVTNPKQL